MRWKLRCINDYDCMLRPAKPLNTAFSIASFFVSMTLVFLKE